MKELIHFLNIVTGKIAAIRNYLFRFIVKKQLGECGKNVTFIPRKWFERNYSRIYLADDTNIYSGFQFISFTGHFYMGAHSGAAEGLTVITGNHGRVVGSYFKDYSSKHTYDVERDVIVEEDVWIGANVILLAGVRVGRGATIGAGSVCLKNVPPYAIVLGNPAKVIGFNYNPEEVIEHEKGLYPEKERYSFDVLEKNYNKYYINKTREIKEFLKH